MSTSPAPTVSRTGQSALSALRSIAAAPYRAAAIVLAAVAADWVFDPVSRHVPTCPLHAITGIWCPFCGGLRSAYELSRLHLRAALGYNVLLVAALPFILVYWFSWARRAHSNQPRKPLSRTVTITLVVIAVAFTIVRNLPFATGLRGQ